MRSWRSVALILAASGAVACSDREPATGPAATPSLSQLGSSRTDEGTVYVATNQTAGNTVWAYARAADGTLSDPESFSTGGTGTGGGLGNQGGVVLTRDGRWLLVVNAGSNDVSVFAVRRDGGLELADREVSGGTRPVSIAVHHRLVYVLNAGGTGNVSGFVLGFRGHLHPLSHSTRPLSSDAAGAAQAEFSPDGDHLVVTEKATNTITLYRVRDHGRLGRPTPMPSEGATPFGFAFSRSGTLVVSEAFGGMPDASALSSYRIRRNDLHTVSPSVGTTETAACWVVITGDQRFAYTSNTGSGTISGYALSGRGELTLLTADGVTATTAAGPIDLALTRDGKLLYSLDEAAGGISGFQVGHDGGLTGVGAVTGLPAGANGLASR